MTHWKTTVFGLGAALIPWLKTVWPEGGTIIDAAASVFLALLGYHAMDKS